MSSQSASLATYGIKNAGNAMADVVFHNISHKERCEEYTHNGIDEVEPVGASLVE